MADVALLVIAIDLTLLSAMAIVYAYRASRAAEAVERTARRMETFLDAMVELGEDVHRVAKDVRGVSRDVAAVVAAVGVTKRARATLAGAKAAVAAFKHHNGSEAGRGEEAVR